MFTVGLAQVKTLDIGRVASYLFNKEVVVVINIPVIKTKAQFPVYPLQGLRPLFNKGDNVDRLRLYTGLKGRQPFRVMTLGHPVMHERQEEC